MCSVEDTYKIMVFRPTLTEFKNFNSYIELMEKEGAHRAGLAKVIPPPEWRARSTGYYEDDIMSLKIPTPISQVSQGNRGLYQRLNIRKKPMTVSDYKILAESDEFKTPDFFNYDDLERKFWKNIMYNPPLFGADVSGSIMDKDLGVWNINKLDTILDYVIEDYGVRIEGVNTAFLYFGMWKSSFAWHTEDMDLYSIYYLHAGYPKTWYTIPPEHSHRFERLARDIFSIEASKCPAFLRHKTTVISPDILKQNSIPFNKITQMQGEFIITFPFGYHLGFDHGFNMAESINFASPRWVEYGKKASQCDCSQNSVKICMDTFVKRIQPEKYELWLRNKNIGPHPKDTSGTLKAPLTSESNILCNRNNTGIPKYNIKAGRKRCHGTLQSDSELPNDTTYANKAINVSPSTSVQGLNKKEYKDEQLNDKQREVMENKLLKADEMDIQNNISDMVNNRCSFEVERLYNIYRSMDDPHCSICMMFNHKKLTFNLDWKIIAKSSVLPTLRNPTKALFIRAVSGHKKVFKEKLIRCVKCFLTVHYTCYGLTEDTSSHWLCDRCMKNPRLVACIYCPFKVGALKEFDINEWSHVECHIFLHSSSPLTINIFPTAFITNQKCVICNLTSGNCFRCSGSSCCAQFHISCGIFAGYHYQIQQKHITLMYCNNHSYIPDKNKIVHINQKVWTRHLIGQHETISECRIVKIDKTPLGIVKYSDGKKSESITLKEIKNYANNFPRINKIIHLKSGDKVLFQGLNYKHMYSVEYYDGTFGCILPDDLHFSDEES